MERIASFQVDHNKLQPGLYLSRRDGEVTTLAVRDVSLARAGLTAPRGLLVQGDRLYICDGFARKVFVLRLG